MNFGYLNLGSLRLFVFPATASAIELGSLRLFVFLVEGDDHGFLSCVLLRLVKGERGPRAGLAASSAAPWLLVHVILEFYQRLR